MTTQACAKKICLLIVDDHFIIRRGLLQILAEHPALGALHEAADGPSALQQLRSQAIDVVLLDIALGERDGLDVLKQIHSEFPHTAVIMLTAYPENQFALRAIRAGAAAYLTKGCDPEELFKAIQKVAGGGVYLSANVAELLAHDVRSNTQRLPHEALSNREFQVLQALAQGLTVGEIAKTLSLSANTISTYRARIFEKLGLRNQTELFVYAARHGLIQGMN